jgi:6-pyruvoyltetrahydropterin/6-carboxytetrahydropterin synthase
MRRLYISTRGSFSTAHFYRQKKWDDKTNAAEFGLCFSEFGHGHNYSVDVTFSTARQLAVNASEYARVFDAVNALIGTVLQDFDHRHLNFTHPAFNSSERISTTEIISEVLESSIIEQWKRPNPALKNWSYVEFCGVQVWETHLLAAATAKSLVCLPRSKGSWSAMKLQFPITLVSGESRSLDIAFFASQKTERLPPSLINDAASFLKNADGKFHSLESLCCAIQENLGHEVLLSTKSDYFLFAGAAGAPAE